MSTKEFDEFLSRQQQIPEAEIDWDEQRDEWLGFLAQFYAEVERYLAAYIASGKVSIQYEEIEIVEELVGRYTARSLRLDVAGHKARLDPIGTNLIGAKGRVDLEGASGKVRFVLVDENLPGPSVQVAIRITDEPDHSEAEPEDEQEEIKWVWKITTPPPRISYLELSQESFLQALLEVVGG